jgi:hypothetical protein
LLKPLKGMGAAAAKYAAEYKNNTMLVVFWNQPAHTPD